MKQTNTINVYIYILQLYTYLYALAYTQICKYVTVQKKKIKNLFVINHLRFLFSVKHFETVCLALILVK